MENKFDTKELIQFYYKLMHDVTDRYFKGYAFFLAINAAVFGYIFSSKVDDAIKNKVLSIGLIICVLFSLATVANSIWTFGIYKTLRGLLSTVTKDHEFESRIYSDTKRGWWLLNVMSVGANCSVFTITIAYIILLS